MKIGFLIGNMSRTGGTERVLQQIANGLAERGHSVVVLSVWGLDRPSFPLDGRVVFRRLREDCPRGPAGHWNAIRAIRRALRREAPEVLVDVDLILTVYTLPAAAGLPGLRRVAWEHFNYYYRFPKHNRLRALARRLAARFSHAVVVLTEEDRGYYERNLRIRGRLCRIYNPKPSAPGVPAAGGEERMVLAAGRLTHVKGFDLLLESWALLEKDFPGWRLCVAGDGEDREKLLEIIEKKGLRAVELPGRVSDMEAWYGRSAFYVLPSRGEGFAMVLLEAMACGRAAVSFTCRTGPREIIRDGVNGFLVPEGDTAAFAERMRRLMESPELCREMGRQARASLDTFDRDRILDQWEELLKGLKPRR